MAVPPPWLISLDNYLSFDHRDDLATGCPMAASASEIGRQDKAVSERFTEGFEQLVALPEIWSAPSSNQGRESWSGALAMMVAMIGGVAASRAVAKTDPKLSNEILRAVRRIVGAVGGEEGQTDGAQRRARTTRKRARVACCGSYPAKLLNGPSREPSPAAATLSCVLVSKSLASCRSCSWLAGSPKDVNYHPRRALTAGRSAIGIGPALDVFCNPATCRNSPAS